MRKENAKGRSCDEKEKKEVNYRKEEIPKVAESVRKRSTGEMIFDALKSAIVSGQLKPGERVIEQELSEQFKTSRIPVREAMMTLEHRGFLERLPLRGFRVSMTSGEEVRETFGIRAALESYAVSMATEYVTPEFIADMEKNVELSYQALAEKDLERFTELNAEFHEMVYKATRSPKLCNMIGALRDYMARYGRPLFHAKGRLTYIQDHGRMLDAIKKGDKGRAEKIAKKHILRGCNYVVKTMGPKKRAAKSN
ncbi:MAG: GntR family transcriptional regulator [Syntrophobacterales bacterium]|jgi:DNA-binding GntR family transcriptional regulator|nr:GntR family transcriptional regulator [Syntrophobacterales bacterium]